MKEFQLSRGGRRNAWLMLVGAALIWIFAIWTFQSTLGISYVPGDVGASLGTMWAEGLTVNRTVPAIFMLVLMVAAPLTMWNISMELICRYAITEQGLRYTAVGVDITIPWDGIADIRTVDADSDEPSDELILRDTPTAQIPNPLFRLLYSQAYGAKVLPVYPGLIDRSELMAEVRRRSGIPAEQPVVTHNSGDELPQS
ncbi:MAG: hypothetical protein RLY87_2091 [Chloroflexota bacterium]|jgi:hypothetical protein